jgi:hypothetical protein
MRKICRRHSKSGTKNFLNKNRIAEIKIRKNEKVIPNLKKEHKKIAEIKPTIEIAKEKLFFTRIF